MTEEVIAKWEYYEFSDVVSGKETQKGSSAGFQVPGDGVRAGSV